MATTAAPTTVGKIIQVIGPVIDVAFDNDHLPELYNAVRVEGTAPDGQVISVTAEVQQHIGRNQVRAVAMSSTDGVTRGMDVIDTGGAITVPVGEIDELTQRLLEVTKRSLDAGIAAATPENHVGDIGAAVQAVVEAAGFSVVRELVGHGVGFSPHEELQIPNYGKPKRGKKLSVGLTIAIEPMVNVGTAKTKTLSDKWTVVTADAKRSAHFEHTVAITEHGPRILTQPLG
mgnify:CR=1 FL=1